MHLRPGTYASAWTESRVRSDECDPQVWCAPETTALAASCGGSRVALVTPPIASSPRPVDLLTLVLSPWVWLQLDQAAPR